MLSKLIKYDIRSTWRDFAGIYMSILLGVIIVPLIINNINNEIVNMAAGFLAFGIAVAVAVVMIANLFKIFNTNVFSKEGYLTMTLPVTPTQIVISKLIVSSMWIVLTGVISLIGLFIFVLILTPPTSFMDMATGFQELMARLNGQSTLTIILLILSCILSATKEVAKLFLACSIAHLKQLNRFRVPVGILSYFIFSWMETLIVQIVTLTAGLFSNHLEKIISQLDSITLPDGMDQFLGVFNGVLGIGMVYSLLLIVVFSLGTVWILNHKLDLD